MTNINRESHKILDGTPQYISKTLSSVLANPRPSDAHHDFHTCSAGGAVSGGTAGGGNVASDVSCAVARLVGWLLQTHGERLEWLLAKNWTRL